MINTFDLDYKHLKRTRRVNGERVIEFTVFPTAENKQYFDLIVEEAIVTFKDDEYVIKKLEEKSIGKTYFKQVTAIHKFYVDLINKQQPQIHNGSITFNNYMQMVFEQTGYNFEVIDQFSARQFQNLGNDNRLALLQKGLDRFKAEFELVDNNKKARIRKMIGRDTDFQFRFGHNIKAINRNIDTTNLATKIAGTGDPELGITASYTSPNVAIFGEIDAPPVNDERFKSQATLLEEMKARIIDEPEVSITVDFIDLRAAGYPYAIPNEGDRIWLIYEPMDGLLIETRILEINEVFDENETITKTEVTLSNHKKSFAGTLFDNVQKQLDGIINDDGVIRYNALDEAVRIATESLQSAQTELEFNNGIIAREKTDPNRLVLLNSAGIGISKDGGHTFTEAITADGFVLTAGAIGRLSANNIQIGPETYYDEGSHPLVQYVHVIKSEYQSITSKADKLLNSDYVDSGDKLGVAIDVLHYDQIYNDLLDLIENALKNEIITSSKQSEIDNKIADYRQKLSIAEATIEQAGASISKVLRDDLRLAAPLPTSLTLDESGITAYTADPNKYARLDYRGLYIKGGAIQIDGGLSDSQIGSSDQWNTQGTYIDENGIYTGTITANQVQVGFNNVSSNVKITEHGLETYDGTNMTSRLTYYGHEFYRNERKIGTIGSSSWAGDSSYRGLSFTLNNDSRYMAWSYEMIKGDNPTTILAWHHQISNKENRGFSFYDDAHFGRFVTFYNDVTLGSEGAGIDLSSSNSISWRGVGSRNSITQFRSGQIQFHMGSTTSTHTFFPDGTKSGGSIEIGNEILGMSPVDSPQILIEYIEFDIELSKDGTIVYLDEEYLEAVSNYAVFLNKGEVIEKADDYFVVIGEGLADARIVGKRIEYEEAFWGDMKSLEKPQKENEPQMRVMSMQNTQDDKIKGFWKKQKARKTIHEVVNGKTMKKVYRKELHNEN